ncbi:hypothetical protein N7478_002091 [Penicillium angulare]|uniref:uncharacterized protein n=1 Tax=Penicillium angulare TaxID=116970 RepID=UPI0025420566|nr:uncharacterized protein N7478_002091 [Penicillium angulare]KAJ5289061.1 hypothetical protein N7478_002091 [Penicillium angulare]
MATRASARQAAHKAKEAISGFTQGSAGPDTDRHGQDGSSIKRKAAAENQQKPNKQRDIEQLDKKPVDSAGSSRTPVTETKPNVEQRAASGGILGTNAPVDQSPKLAQGMEAGVHRSDERASSISSNIVEKGIIYFFFRPRVNIDDPQSIGDVARSFFVLRPTPLGAEFNGSQGPMDKDARCRLLMLPKKKFPTSPKERDMAFVEKAGQSVTDLQEKFIASSTYQTATRGERTTEDARPYAEGVYAIVSAQRSSHLAYELTIPAELGEIQQNFGLHQRGDWILQSKNPKFPGPPLGQLPQEPQYPEHVLEKFGDLRWVPLQPEFIEYPNAQILMIGQGTDTLGKAATAEGDKKPGEAEPGQEIDRLADENEERIHSLQGEYRNANFIKFIMYKISLILIYAGNETVFLDLGLDAKRYRSLPTTWSSS